eukprot:CAMPEP_0173088580 /NCGR_PEP_ID=MMETSP1102-20130122/25078_1 /TAXON_ID=49646 /ORGANISM="Geminigera sp., Strain Caron Lab Isolate" /LENGTH=33 /DNA_ID= /DNA_START= /DNA_END= /DNA_ORIENTATION=
MTFAARAEWPGGRANPSGSPGATDTLRLPSCTA